MGGPRHAFQNYIELLRKCFPVPAPTFKWLVCFPFPPLTFRAAMQRVSADILATKEAYSGTQTRRNLRRL